MVPDFLYKYRALTSVKDLEYSIDTIVKGSIFFGNSFSFNDVFDCRPAIVWDCSDEQFIYYAVKRLQKRKHLPFSFHETAFVRGLRAQFGTLADPRTPEGRHATQAQFAEATGKLGVFCATSRANNLLMWSHYAASCTGICFELSSADGHWHEVRYLPDRPTINLSLEHDSEKMIGPTFFVKSLEWAYEEEWRMLGARGVASLPRGALKRVIFGVNCSHDTREKIRKVIYDNGLAVGIAMAVALLDRFEFDIVDLDVTKPLAVT